MTANRPSPVHDLVRVIASGIVPRQLRAKISKCLTEFSGDEMLCRPVVLRFLGFMLIRTLRYEVSYGDVLWARVFGWEIAFNNHCINTSMIPIVVVRPDL